VRNLLAWGERSADHLGEDTADYLQEERDVLPVDWEVEGFIEGVDTLRSDVDRIAARVKRLQRMLESED
jgi:ubiquinone biosynthesis protein UbiJ